MLGKLILPFFLSALPALPAQVNWLSFKGPAGEEWSRMGTDGKDLYFTTAGNQLWRWRFLPGTPNFGRWTRLKDAPRKIDGWDSYRGLAFQGGYLYTSAIPSSGGGRTILRYSIAKDSWEIWGNPTGTGKDLTICNTSGNGLFLSPTVPGVGYSAWHAGGWWVSFDWNKKTANNNWKSTSGLGVPNANWVSRNEGIAYDGAGVYYSMKNDWIKGLSGGDVVYKFTLTGAPTLVAKKPWEAGAGQTIQFIPKGCRLNASGGDEIWLFRGGDCAVKPHEGWSKAGTRDFAVRSLTLKKWVLLKTPFYMGQGTDSVRIGDYLFIKPSGDAKSAAVYNDIFMVLVPGAAFEAFGLGCAGSGKYVPLIHPEGGPPALGNFKFKVGIDRALGGAPAVLILGTSAKNWGSINLPLDLTPYGVPGCSLQVSWVAAHSLSALSGTGPGGGAGSFPQPIPPNPTLTGANLFYQWLVVDSGAGRPLPLAFTGGGRALLAK